MSRITEEDLRKLLDNDKDTTNSLAKSFMYMASERSKKAIDGLRPREWKKGKAHQYAWDDDVPSAVGLAITNGFDKWRKNGIDKLNPEAFVSYVLQCIDNELLKTKGEHAHWKRLSSPETKEGMRLRNSELVDRREKRYYDPTKDQIDREGYQLFFDGLSDEERTVLTSEVSIPKTAESLGVTEYRVKQVRKTLIKRFDELHTLAV